MKVAFLLTGPNGGGAERAMINVANHLAGDSSHEVVLILGRGDGAMRGAIAANVRVVDLGARRGRSIPRPLSAQVRRDPPDVLVSAGMMCDLIALSGRVVGRWRTKIVISVQNDPVARAQGSMRRLERWWPTLIRLSYRHADAVVGSSSGVARTVANLLGRPPDSVPVIHNAVVSAGFADELQEAPDHPWFHDDGAPVILSAGRLTRQKDFPTLLRAFRMLRDRRKARLIIIGEGEERDALERLAAELGIVEQVAMPGFVANPYAWMRGAALFVLSSQWEGFGNVLAEALACGTPVVATDCPSGPGEIVDGGRYGRLVPVADIERMARAMDEALGAPINREELAMRGMQFSVEQIAPRYQTLIEGTVAS